MPGNARYTGVGPRRIHKCGGRRSGPSHSTVSRRASRTPARPRLDRFHRMHPARLHPRRDLTTSPTGTSPGHANDHRQSRARSQTALACSRRVEFVCPFYCDCVIFVYYNYPAKIPSHPILAPSFSIFCTAPQFLWPARSLQCFLYRVIYRHNASAISRCLHLTFPEITAYILVHRAIPGISRRRSWTMLFDPHDPTLVKSFFVPYSAASKYLPGLETCPRESINGHNEL